MRIVGLSFLMTILYTLLILSTYAVVFQHHLPHFYIGDLIFGLCMIFIIPIMLCLLTCVLISAINDYRNRINNEG